jgi:hypothetical protein
LGGEEAVSNIGAPRRQRKIIVEPAPEPEPVPEPQPAPAGQVGETTVHQAHQAEAGRIARAAADLS